MGLKENTHKNTKVKNASPKALYVDIGKRLRMLRFELDYTQEQMAETLGLSLAYCWNRLCQEIRIGQKIQFLPT